MIIIPKPPRRSVSNQSAPWAAIALGITGILALVWFLALARTPLPTSSSDMTPTIPFHHDSPPDKVETTGDKLEKHAATDAEARFEMRRDLASIQKDQQQHIDEELRENSRLPESDRSPLAPTHASVSRTQNDNDIIQ